MIRQIIFALIAFILIALLAMWVVGGGPRRLVEGTRDAITTVSSIGTDTETKFRLPWQPVQIFPTPDITELLNLSSDTDKPPANDYETEYGDIEAEYDALKETSESRRLIGESSPYATSIHITDSAFSLRESEVGSEYVEISANFSNTTEIDVTGWVIESALSGTRIMIPPGVSFFSSDAPNTLGRIVLAPGMRILVASGPSPVGVSFHENMCSGYLTQFQSFVPEMSRECPSPSSVLPLTGENLQRYGETCFDAIKDLRQCEFPERLPNNITSVCRSFLVSSLSYSGCVRENSFRSSFFTDTWRAYVGSQQELWRNSHDAIRLLDEQGRTVSVFVY